jgi:demethylmenaquinone methyltransferase / 2-methoxy-6-polyprenyl-1,4-benzoquinol methylase
MANLKGSDRITYVRRMFGRIAPHYDLLNRLMTFGQDLHWRRETIACLDVQKNSRVLDNGCGTGDLALEISIKYPSSRVFASDLTPEMLALARCRSGSEKISWIIADAAHLPFASGAFQGVVSGYLLRNVPDVPTVLDEQERILEPGGRLAALDTTPPRGPASFLVKIYLRWIIPFLGRLISGDSEAYSYLPQSTEQFLTAEKLAERLNSAGFQDVSFVRRMFGSMAIHRASKPGSPSNANPNPNSRL